MIAWTFFIIAFSLFMGASIVFFYGLIVHLLFESECNDGGLVATVAVFIIPVWLYVSYIISGVLM